MAGKRVDENKIIHRVPDALISDFLCDKFSVIASPEEQVDFFRMGIQKLATGRT